MTGLSTNSKHWFTTSFDNSKEMALDVTHAHTHTHTHARTHARTHTRRWHLESITVVTLIPNTAVFSYAIGPRKLSVNEQFFVGVQTVVSLLQTTQIKQEVSFIAANEVYTSTNKTTIV